jgi:uncharacterized protein involved in exopolysaccharide biosynthesis
MEERAPLPDRYPDIVPAERASTYLLALRKRWWLVLGTTAVAAWTGFLVSSLQQNRYDATAKVLLTNTEPLAVLQHSTIPTSQDPERDLNTETALVKLDSSARNVRAALNLPLTSTQLLREVSAQAAGTSNIVAITARDSRPARAAAIANAFARVYVDVRRGEAQAAYRTAARQAQRQLARLSPGQQASAEGAALRRQLQQLQVAGTLQTGGAQFVDAATVPTSAATPRPLFIAAVAALIGFLLGALAAIAAGQMSFSSLRLKREVSFPSLTPKRGKADEGGSVLAVNNGFAALVGETLAEHVNHAEKPAPVPEDEPRDPAHVARAEES